MYNCSFCRQTSRPCVSRQSWPILRPDDSIAADRSACVECYAMLTSGMPETMVVRLRRVPEKAQEPVAPPPPPVPVAVQTVAAVGLAPVSTEVVQGVEILGVKIDLPTRMIAPNPKKGRPKTKRQRKEAAREDR